MLVYPSLHAQTEMVDLLSADAQEVVAVVGRSKGLVLMSPPSDNNEAKTNLAAMTSALKAGTKVGHARLDAAARQVLQLWTMHPDSQQSKATQACLLQHSCVQVIIAESYGGNDEPVDVLAQSLTNAGAELVVNPLRVKELPQQALYQQFEEAGEQGQWCSNCQG
jgi:flavorubredoxin